MFTMLVALLMFVFFENSGVDSSAHFYDGFMACGERFEEGDPGALFKIRDTAPAVIIGLCEGVKG